MTIQDALIGRLNNCTARGEIRAQGETWRLLHDLILLSAGGGASGSARQIVFRPGVASDPTKDVYATFAEVYTRKQALDGLIDLVIDDSNAAAEVPSGTYDLTGCRLVAFAGDIGGNTLTLLDGADLQFLTGVSGFLLLQGNSATPCLTFGSPGLGERGPVFRLEKGASIGSLNAPMINWSLGGARSFYLLLDSYSTFGDFGSPVINLGDTGTLNVLIDDESVLADESIAGNVDSIVFETYTYGAGLPGSLSSFSGTENRFPLPNQPGAVFYVDPIGSDTRNDGSIERPFQTPLKAITWGAANTPGRFTVYLMPGAYDPFTIDTSIPFTNLTLEGFGNPEDVYILGGGIGIELRPGITEENAILGLTLRNLTIDANQCVVAEGLSAFSTNFLLEGLKIENCHLLASGFSAFTVQATKAGNVSAKDSSFDGDISLVNCGRGRWSNAVSNNLLTIDTDRLQVLPLSGVEPFDFVGCKLTDVELLTQAQATFDPGTKFVTMACQAIDNASPMTASFSGECSDTILFSNVDDPVNPPVFNADRCKCEAMAMSGFVVPTNPIVVFARGAVLAEDGGAVDIGENYHLDMRKSACDESKIFGDVSGNSACNRDVATGAIPAGAGHNALTFKDGGGSDLPFMPGASYVLATELDTAVAVAISAKSEAGFTVTKSGATAGRFAAILS